MADKKAKDPLIEEAKEDSKRNKEVVLALKISEKAEELRLAELDVNRTFEAGRQLFTNSCDYIKKRIMPVHDDHELLKDHAKILGKWMSMIEEWSSGIGIGRSPDIEKIQQILESIIKDSDKVFKKEIKFRDSKIEPIKKEIVSLNDEITNLS